MDERIAGAEVIARVKLRSVAQVAEHYGYKDKAYGVALEFSFDVIEYLKGNGSSTLVAVPYDMDVPFRTRLGASLFGEDLLAERDTSWDDRGAIIFLADDHPSLPSSEKADRYWFGVLRFRGLEHYTIASRYAKHWLPAAVPNETGGVSASVSTDPSFLLDVPSRCGWTWTRPPRPPAAASIPCLGASAGSPGTRATS